MGEKQDYSVFYRHFDLPANFPVIALLGPTWISRAEPVRRIHFHNCLEIGWLYEGKGLYYIDGEIIPIEAPCVTLAPQNVPHFTRAAEGSLCRWNWLYTDPVQLLRHASPQAVNALSEYLRRLPARGCVLTADDNPQTHTLIQMIIEELGGEQPNRQEVARELFSAMFLILSRRQMPGAPQRYADSRMSCIEPAISFIASNYMNEVSITTLAGLCHVSVSHFRRLFKQVLGWSPQEYLQIIRADRACAMLYNCDYSVTQIAESVGYPSPSSFNRQFKQRYLMSPSRWRQKVRGEENPVVTAYFNALPSTTMQFFPNEYDGLRQMQDRKDG